MTFENALSLGGDNRATEIKNAHAEGVQTMKGSLRYFVKAGEILAQVQAEVESFPKWIEENLNFKRKTAYQYIALFRKCESGEIDLDSGKFTSIRQCLGIDHDGKKSTYQAKLTDKRMESLPMMAMKMDQYWKKGISKTPIEKMSPDERRTLKKSLKPILDIYESL